MTILRVADMGRGGLNTDVQEINLPPNNWTRLENIDIDSGDIRSAWGEELLDGTLPLEPKYIYSYRDRNLTKFVISDGTNLYINEGTGWANTMPGGGLLGGGVVTFTVFLGTLVVNSSASRAYYLQINNVLAELPGWLSTWRAFRIVAFSNFLVALGFNDQSTNGPDYTVAWSDAAAAGEIPQNWDFASGTSQAGLRQIRDTDGILTTAEQLRDDLIIYKTDSIYRLFLSNDVNVFNVERVISDHGCDALLGVAAIGNRHYFSDSGDIRIFDGQQTVSIAAIRIKEELEASIDPVDRDRNQLVAWPEREQLWVGVVPSGQTNIQTVLIYDLLHQSWTRREHADVRGMTLGDYIGDPVAETTNGSVILSNATQIYRSNKSSTDQNGAAKSCIAERTGLKLGDIDQSLTIRRIYPEMEGTATVNLELAYQWRIGGPITWTSPKTFAIGTDRYLKYRVTGMPVGIRVTSTSTQGWRLAALNIDSVPARRR